MDCGAGEAEEDGDGVGVGLTPAKSETDIVPGGEGAADGAGVGEGPGGGLDPMNSSGVMLRVGLWEVWIRGRIRLRMWAALP